MTQTNEPPEIPSRFMELSMKINHLFFLLSFIFVAALTGGCATNTTSFSSSSLVNSASTGDVATVSRLIDQGADVNEKDEVGITPLVGAAHYGSKVIVALLIAKGADVNLTDNYSETPLHMAAKEGYEDIAELLISKGAEINAKDNLGNTPLHKAALNDQNDVAQLLLAKGANPDMENSSGVTPIMIANEKANFELQGILDKYVKATFDKTVMDYRNAKIKPTLPEDARKYNVQAVGAVRDKKFDEALELYSKALDIAPWWPDGHFNRAIVFSEIKSYQGAIHEMKRYLALVPNAPDARAAQDKIYEWERKTGTSN